MERFSQSAQFCAPLPELSMERSGQIFSFRNQSCFMHGHHQRTSIDVRKETLLRSPFWVIYEKQIWDNSNVLLSFTWRIHGITFVYAAHIDYRQQL